MAFRLRVFRESFHFVFSSFPFLRSSSHQTTGTIYTLGLPLRTTLMIIRNHRQLSRILPLPLLHPTLQHSLAVLRLAAAKRRLVMIRYNG